VLRARFWEYFRQLRSQGRTLVVTTQVVSEAVYCDYVAVMRKGRILAVDTPENLRKMALGGEIIDVSLAKPDDVRRAMGVLLTWRRTGDNGRPAVQDVQRAPGSEHGIHVVVDDAREWLPEVLNRLENQRPKIAVESAAPIEVTYDEIFIKIMQQDEQKQEAR
jgi:ABC-2 type transport system ATP-binding protein